MQMRVIIAPQENPFAIMEKISKIYFRKTKRSRAFHFYLESVEMLSVFVFAAKRMVKGAATLTSFALGKEFAL